MFICGQILIYVLHMIESFNELILFLNMQIDRSGVFFVDKDYRCEYLLFYFNDIAVTCCFCLSISSSFYQCEYSISTTICTYVRQLNTCNCVSSFFVCTRH